MANLLFDFLYFLIFLFFAQLFLSFIAKFASINIYFWKLLPVLIGYSCFSGFIYNIFNFNIKFYWYILFSLLISIIFEHKFLSINKKTEENFKNDTSLKKNQFYSDDMKIYFRSSVYIHLIIYGISYLALSNSLVKLF